MKWILRLKNLSPVPRTCFRGGFLVFLACILSAAAFQICAVLYGGIWGYYIGQLSSDMLTYALASLIIAVVASLLMDVYIKKECQ